MKRIYIQENIQPDQENNLVQEAIFHNANGYIGVRGCLEEGCPQTMQSIRGSYINGFYDFAEMNQAEKLYGLVQEKQTILNVADTQTIRLHIGKEVFSIFEGTLEENTRILNMEEGWTERRVVWTSPQGKKVRICSRRMVSFVRLPLFLIRYSVCPLNFDGDILIESIHSGDVQNYCNPDDPRVAGEKEIHLRALSTEITNDISILESMTVKSKLKVCTAVAHKLNVPCDITYKKSDNSIERRMAINLKKDTEAVLYKYTVFCDSVRMKQCKREAVDYLSNVINIPTELLYKEQKDYLDEYWKKAELEIVGDDELNLALCYNLYELLQSVGKDRYCSITAKGLSGEGYEGHYFWDTEMYIEPYFLLTEPSITKSLIEYRYNTLSQAKENARILGHTKGALYPWRTIMGKECSGYFPSGSAAYHINGDIAYSVIAYYLATKDIEFIKEKGMDILIETARLWMDAGTWYKGTFRINEVTGPDEYTCLVNNNYYTNALAKYHLYWTAKFYDILGSNCNLKSEEVDEFIKASECMYLPYDTELGINPQDDDFLEKKIWNLEKTPKDKFPLLLHYHPLYLYRHQVCKQADTVLAHFILEDMQNRDTIYKSYLYYEKITTHDSSLSKAIFSIVASKLGLEEKAYSYFGDSAKLDLYNTHKNTKDGIHTANMGGSYMTLVYGFGGVRIKEDGLFISPSLPQKWKSYKFNICYENSLIQINVEKNECRIHLKKGTSIEVHLYGKSYLLQDSIVQKNNYKAVIFDLDGVLCQTDHYHYRAWKEVADEIGVYFDEQINNRLRGVSRKESFEIILEQYNGNMSEKEKNYYIAKKNDIYVNLLEKMTPNDINEEVIETLKTLKKRGCKLAIGSSSKNTKLILQKLGIIQYFDAISDGCNIEHSKPDPQVFLMAAQFIEIDNKDCLVVEDALAGVEAAKAAGMGIAGLSDAATSEGCDFKLESIADLVKILK